MKKFNYKGKYDKYMDPQCIDICNALNSLPGIETTESCCGHNKNSFMIFFKVKNSKQGLFFLTRCVDRRYWRYGNDWTLELNVGDMFIDKHLPITYFLHSGNIKGQKAYKQIKDLVENMEHHLNHKGFIEGFKINLSKFNIKES